MILPLIDAKWNYGKMIWRQNDFYCVINVGQKNPGAKKWVRFVSLHCFFF